MANWTLKEKSTGDLSVTISGDEWQKALTKAFNKIAGKVTIAGFRKGHAPRSLLAKQISAQEKYLQAIDDHANEWMRKALKESGLEPISQPQLDIREVGDDKAELVYTFAVMPEVTLGEYKGLKYEVEDITVSDDDVDAEIERLRQSYAELEVSDDAAAEGDTVNINYEGFKDEIAFAGGKADNYDLKLGSHTFIPGFEDQLVGVKAGEDRELSLKFPEEYHDESLRGADVIFKVHVNEVKKEVLPEVDDDFARDLNFPDIEDLASLKEMIRDRLFKQREDAATAKAENALMDEFAEVVSCDMPDVLVEQEVQAEINQMNQQLQQYGMSLSQYLSMTGKKAEDLKEDYRQSAEKTVRLRLGLEAVAKKENLEPSEEETEKEYTQIAEQYKMEIDQVKTMIDPEMLKQDVRNQKALAYLKDNAHKA